MATRSLIGIRTAGGRIKAAYCHWDGYPGWLGQRLLDHWNDPDRIEQVLEIGSISVLGTDYGSTTASPHIHIWEYQRSEKFPKTYGSEFDLLLAGRDYGADYVYLWNPDSGWSFARINHDYKTGQFKTIVLENLREYLTTPAG